MRRRIASQEGAAILEFAIVLPLLLLLVFGIIEFGIILYNQQVISNASREAARYAIVQPASGTLHRTSNIQQVVTDFCNNNLKNFSSNSLTTAVKDAAIGGELNTAANVCSSIASPDKDIQVEVEVHIYEVTDPECQCVDSLAARPKLTKDSVGLEALSGRRQQQRVSGNHHWWSLSEYRQYNFHLLHLPGHHLDMDRNLLLCDPAGIAEQHPNLPVQRGQWQIINPVVFI